MDFTPILNAIGISFEIAGFVLLLFAIKAMPFKGGGFTSGLEYLGNVMSTLHPRINRLGICLVIVGLGFQLIALIPIWNWD